MGAYNQGGINQEKTLPEMPERFIQRLQKNAS
jgi:hypothetical protein